MRGCNLMFLGQRFGGVAFESQHAGSRQQTHRTTTETGSQQMCCDFAPTHSGRRHFNVDLQGAPQIRHHSELSGEVPDTGTITEAPSLISQLDTVMRGACLRLSLSRSLICVVCVSRSSTSSFIPSPVLSSLTRGTARHAIREKNTHQKHDNTTTEHRTQAANHREWRRLVSVHRP